MTQNSTTPIPTPAEITHMLRSCVLDASRFLTDKLTLLYPARLVITETVKSRPDYAASWVCYAMENIAWTAGYNDRQLKAQQAELTSANARIADLEAQNFRLREDVDALDIDLSALTERHAALQMALDALTQQINRRVTDDAQRAALTAQVALIAEMAGAE